MGFFLGADWLGGQTAITWLSAFRCAESCLTGAIFNMRSRHYLRLVTPVASISRHCLWSVSRACVLLQ